MINTAAKGGTEAAVTSRPTFQEAREQYQSAVFTFVSRRIRPVEEAEDIVAQVFVDAFTDWHRRRGSPKLWLFGIARRKVCDALRKKKGWWSIQERDQSGDAYREFLHAAEVSDAIGIVMVLPANQRDAFLLQTLEELSIEEIAAIMNRSVGSVNSLLQRARANIQKALDRGRFK